MKKNIPFLILLVVIVMIIQPGCDRSSPPLTLTKFQRNTTTENYWGVCFTDTGPYLFFSNGEDTVSYDIICKVDVNMYDYESFKKEVKYILIYNLIQGKSYLWIKSNRKFQGPSVETVENEDENNLIFNTSRNNLSASMNNVYRYRKSNDLLIDSWNVYKALYNVERAKYLPLNYSKGEVLFLLNNSNTILKEIYMNKKRWDYIRYVEVGKFNMEIDDKDPESILKAVWWAYLNKIEPFKNQLEELEVIK